MSIKSISTSRNISNFEEKTGFSCGYSINPILSDYLFDFTIPYYSCFLILEGKGVYKDDNDFIFDLEPGILVERFPDISHNIIIDTKNYWKSFYISVDSISYELLLSLGVININKPISKCPLSKDLTYMLNELSNKVNNRLDSRFNLHQSILNHIYKLVTKIGLPCEVNPLVEKAKNLLADNFQKTYSLKDISEILCVGEESFRKTFKQEVGLSPMIYRNNMRMITAKKLLTSHHTVSEIAEMLGYSDSSSFSKQFKLHWGYSPNDFRKFLS